MKKITILYVWALLCLNFCGSAQVRVDLSAGLKVGDVVGEDFWKTRHMVYDGGKMGVASLERYRGKLLVLDFWASWCGACIGNFDKMIGLQEQFAARVKILPVTYEDEVRFRGFMAGVNGDKIEKLGSIVADKVLGGLFPHRLIPHYVWIGADGKVVAITSGDNFAGGGISQVLDGGLAGVAMKIDRDLDRPLFSRDDLVVDSLLYYSILVKGMLQGTGGSREVRRVGGVERGYLYTNHSLKGLYANCFRGIDGTYSSGRLEVQLSSTEGFTFEGSALAVKDWYKKNAYSLDVIVPVSRSAFLYSDMLEALNRYGPYEGVVMPVMSRCLVLRCKGGADGFVYQKGGFVNRRDSSGWEMNMVPMVAMVNTLNRDFGLGVPVIDETGYTGTISLKLPAGDLKLGLLKRELSGYGLELVPAKRPINRFIIRDKIVQK